MLNKEPHICRGGQRARRHPAPHAGPPVQEVVAPALTTFERDAGIGVIVAFVPPIESPHYSSTIALARVKAPVEGMVRRRTRGANLTATGLDKDGRRVHGRK